MNGSYPFGQIDVSFRAFPDPRMLEQVSGVRAFVRGSNKAEKVKQVSISA